MAKIIAIANQKGGVGKTTTTINLASSLAVAEKRILLIDTDPQANAGSGIGIKTTGEEKSIYDVLIGNEKIENIIRKYEMIPYLDIVPANINLVAAEIELVNLTQRESKLKQAIHQVEKNYDYIVIDCPPSLGLITLNAFTAAHSVLIPVQCEYYALEGLGQLLNTINMVRKNLNPNLEIEGVLLTMYDGRLKLSVQVVEEVKKYFKQKVYKTLIRRNVKLSEAPSFGKPIILYDAQSLGSHDYMSLASEVLHQNK